MQLIQPEEIKSAVACRLCGRCCGPYFALYVSECDGDRWRAEGRTDLLERLEWERERVRWDRDEPYNAETGEPFRRCVFLSPTCSGHAACLIHNTKPQICRDYPPGSSDLCALYAGPRSPTPPDPQKSR